MLSDALKHPDEAETRAGARERRWPVGVALVLVGVFYGVLPERLWGTPWWMAMGGVVLLEVPALFVHRRLSVEVTRMIGLVGSTAVTLFLIVSVGLLVRAALDKERSALELLRAAALLWMANILVFAAWYWRLDAGGPTGREKALGHKVGSFLFPQMMMKPEQLPRGQKNWSPAFVDYLYLAFNTSTAFSPTDTPVLSRWAKALTMLQATLSLTVVAVLIARAVNQI